MKYKNIMFGFFAAMLVLKNVHAGVVVTITVNSLGSQGTSNMCELPDALELAQNLYTSNNWYNCSTYIERDASTFDKNVYFNIVFEPNLFSNLPPGQIKNIVFDKLDIGLLPVGLHLIGPGNEKLQLLVAHDAAAPFLLYKNMSGLGVTHNRGINLSGISIKNTAKNKTCFVLEDPENISLEDMVFDGCTDSAIKIINHTDFLHDVGFENAGKLIIKNSVFSNNISTRGGAIESIGVQGNGADYGLHYFVSVDSSLFEGNQALVGGAFAGLGLSGLVVEFASSNSSFIGNKALWGGALHAGNAVNFYLENTTLAQNQAYNQGGAVYIHKDSYNFSALYSTIAENKAVEGGGIYADMNGAPNTNSISASIIADNNSIAVRDKPTEGNDIWVVAGNGAPNTFNVYDALIKSPFIVSQQAFFRLTNTVLNQDPKLAPLGYYPFLGGRTWKVGANDYSMMVKPLEKRYPPLGQLPVTNYSIKTDQLGQSRFPFTAPGAIEMR